MAGPAEAPEDATPHTLATNRVVFASLPFADTQGVAGARGLIVIDPLISTEVARAAVSPDVLRAMRLAHIFDLLGGRLNGDKAEGRRIVIDRLFPDLGPLDELTLMFEVVEPRRPV